MIIIKIKAGLGNQMFQYAFGKALSLERNEELFLDISSFDNQPVREAKREFTLNKFNISSPIIDGETTKKYNSAWRVLLRKIYRNIQKTSAYTYSPSFMKSTSTYFEGYWINQKYFIKHKEEIRKSFTLKNNLSEAGENVKNRISECLSKSEVSVSINIRRGDFVTNPNSAFNGILGVPHYQKAIELLQSEYKLDAIHAFVFSDDIQWAKENLTLPCVIHFVSDPSIPDYEELILVSMCSHNIIANSTFSWWGAWLNENKQKIVIAPKQWLKDSTAEELDILPSEWITI